MWVGPCWASLSGSGNQFASDNNRYAQDDSQGMQENQVQDQDAQGSEVCWGEK